MEEEKIQTIQMLVADVVRKSVVWVCGVAVAKVTVL